MLYYSAVEIHPPGARVTVSGELDMYSTPHLDRDFRAAVAAGCSEFTIDASGVTFIDAAGLGAFARLHNATTTRGGSLTFEAASRYFLWVCSVAGLLSVFDLDAPIAVELLA